MTRPLVIPAAGELHLTPEAAGWSSSGLRVLRLDPGEPRPVATGDAECFVLPLQGSLTVDTGDERFDLRGRDSVFAAVSDFVYVGRDTAMTLTSAAGAEVALPSARCATRRPARYGPAADVPVEVRGAGPATRQVTNFGTPGAWDHAERLMACEVLTPPGNWSSWPAHKHDASAGSLAVDEEVYLYRVAGPDGVTPDRRGFGLHRTYCGPEHAAAGLDPIDLTTEVRDLDTVLVPHGYHGPSVAAPGYALYYLNVLAGPGRERSMAFCDDPAHGWVRDTWAGAAPDRRCPMTSADGRTKP